MLVLTRRPGESVKIGDDITVIVHEVHRGQVKLAIRAPKDTAILRAELVGRDADAS